MAFSNTNRIWSSLIVAASTGGSYWACCQLNAGHNHKSPLPDEHEPFAPKRQSGGVLGLLGFPSKNNKDDKDNKRMNDLRSHITKLEQDYDAPDKKWGRIKSYHSNAFKANPSIEDTFAVSIEMEGMPGALFGMFDGHSGGLASMFCRDNLFNFIFDDYENRKEKRSVLHSESFLKADKAFLDSALAIGDLSGACANVVHIDGREITVANIGDCRAFIGRKTIDPKSGKVKWMAVPLSMDHDLSVNKDERERLLREHPSEPDVLYRNRIKGHLQPTRGMGDGCYKDNAFLQYKPRYMRKHMDWSAPYTTARADIMTHTLDRSDHFLVVATDGLFGNFTSDQVVEYVRVWNGLRKQKQPPKETENKYFKTIDYLDAANMNVCSWLIYHSLVASGRRCFGEQYTRGSILPLLSPTTRYDFLEQVIKFPGRKRSIHDDITVLVAFFDHSTDHTKSKL